MQFFTNTLRVILTIGVLYACIAIGNTGSFVLNIMLGGGALLAIGGLWPAK